MTRHNNNLPNRLAQETSPYLKQHMHNPVDWYAWGNEAFERARQEDKPIFLSIGYSTCHWCHVMAHESFESAEIAPLMNKYFVCIKLDREERPDIDNVYMKVCQALTGHGGWPLTIFMTPEKKPFYAATYIPPVGRHGRPGMVNLLPSIYDAWINQRDEIEQSGDEILRALADAIEQNGKESEEFQPEIIAELAGKAMQNLMKRYDAANGGFGNRPKFPSPQNFLFLLREAQIRKNYEPVNLVHYTLLRMRAGGIYDQLGFGFHRYSTDNEWRLPHFEKMLYDQAMLLMAYTEAFIQTGKNIHAQVCDEILQFLRKEFLTNEGLFISATDADSEGEEGTFYIWDYAELTRVLSAAEMQYLSDTFEIHPNGNFHDEASGQPTGKNIFLLKSQGANTENWEKSLGNLQTHPFSEIREKLYEYRNQREKPSADTKILADWNALLLFAIARAARVFPENPTWRSTADKLAAQLLVQYTKEDTVYHLLKAGQQNIEGLLDDYAFMISAFLEYYQTSFEPEYLIQAMKLLQGMKEKFMAEDGSFYQSPHNYIHDILIRSREFYDGAIPSGNSFILHSLFQVAKLTGNMTLLSQYQNLRSAYLHAIKEHPAAGVMALAFLREHNAQQFEIVLSRYDAAIIAQLRKKYGVDMPILVRDQSLENLAPYIAEMREVNGETAIYLCQNQTCQLPVTTVAGLP